MGITSKHNVFVVVKIFNAKTFIAFVHDKLIKNLKKDQVQHTLEVFPTISSS